MYRKKPQGWKKLFVILFGGILLWYSVCQLSSIKIDSSIYMFRAQAIHSMDVMGRHVIQLSCPVLVNQDESSSFIKRLPEQIQSLAYPIFRYRREFASIKSEQFVQDIPKSFYEDGGQSEHTGAPSTSEQVVRVGTNFTNQGQMSFTVPEQATEMIPATEETTTEAVVFQDIQTSQNQSNHTYSKQYTDEQLTSFAFVKSALYSIDDITPVKKSDLNIKKLYKMNLHIKKEEKQPKILIYHTHTSEAFADSKPEQQEDTVVGVGTELAKELTDKYGITVYHDKTVYDVINGKLDRSLAYNEAAKNVEKILNANPSIDVVIDLHRDGVAEQTHLTTTYHNRQIAQVMLFNGMSRLAGKGEIAYLYNPNRAANLAFSLQLQLRGIDQYPGLMRKIFLRSYRYNLHFKERSLLVEVGAQTNTVEEAKGAMEPFAHLLSQVLTGDS